MSPCSARTRPLTASRSPAMALRDLRVRPSAFHQHLERRELLLKCSALRLQRALYLLQRNRWCVQYEAVNARPSRRLSDARLSQRNALVREFEPPVHGARAGIGKRAQADIDRACSCLEPRPINVYRLKGVRPARQISRIPQKFEDFVTGSSDLDTLHVKCPHRRLLL